MLRHGCTALGAIANGKQLADAFATLRSDLALGFVTLLTLICFLLLLNMLQKHFEEHRLVRRALVPVIRRVRRWRRAQ